MKSLTYLLAAVLMMVTLLPTGSGYAQQSARKSLPQVPITYPGDTDETIIRRAQWIEGAKKEGAVEWWGVTSAGDTAGLLAEFKKIYPFITVNYWRGTGEEVSVKLDAEIAVGRFSVDLTLGAEPYNFPRWRKMAILEKFTDIIPGIKSMDKRMYSKHNDWMMPGNMAITPQYNTKLVSAAEAPKTWENLLDPKWKKQIAITTDVKAWTILAVEEGGWGIEKTEDFLRKLGQQQPIWAASRPNAQSLLITGEFKIMGETYLPYQFQSQDKGAPVEWSRVRPVPVPGTLLALQKRAPHPNAANLFLEWLFSPQGLLIYDKITLRGVTSSGAGTRQAKALDGLPLVYQTEEGVARSIELGLEKRFVTLLGAVRE